MRIKIGRRVLFVVLLSVAIVGSSYLVWQKEKEERRYRGNLSENFSFEMVDTSGKLAFWAEDSRGGWSVSTGDPYQGERCAQGTVGWSWLWQKVPARKDKYYVLKAYLKSDITIPSKTGFENTFLGLECFDENGKIIKSEYGIANAPSFWQQRVRHIYAPAGTVRLGAKLAKRQGEGSIWFDNIELEEFSSVILNNPGFEAVDQLDRLDAWAEDAKGGWSVTTEESYEGERSVQATVSWSWLSQDIPVRPDKYYTLGAYLKSDIAFLEEDDWNAFLALECLDEKYEIIAEQMSQSAADSLWRLQEVSIYAPENTDKMRVKLAKRRGGEGSVWFDNIKMTESAWYIKIKFLRRILEDKPFFIFYICVYLVLLIFLVRLILKRR